MSTPDQKKLVVVGGGAAGFFCAVNAARLNPALKVIIVEKTAKLLSKVRVSGGGRCNVTHACSTNSELIRNYPRGGNFLKKLLPLFNTLQCEEWFKERGVQLKVEEDGRMFPTTDTSETVINCLIREANKYNVEILMSREVRQIELISPHKEARLFRLWTSVDEQPLNADFLCLACGGYPKTGAYDWLRKLGHSAEEPVPSLFTFNMPGNSITELMGVTVANSTVKVAGTKLVESGPLLITHWGMSGPAILKLSAWGARELAEKKYHFTILVNWVPQYHEQSLRQQWQEIRLQHVNSKIANRNPFDIPARLWEYLLKESGVSSGIRWGELPAKQQNVLISLLTSQPFGVSGKTTFKEEFVTAGGIRLSEIEPTTMQSKLIPRLFFAGELIDVDGITGGFNFQHAWASGFVAANTIAGIDR